MSWVDIIRVIVLAWTFFCSLIAMALAADLTSISESLVKQYFTWAALAIAVGILSITSIPAMVVVDLLRTGAFTSMIVVELSWLSVLHVLWLVVGAMAASSSSNYWGGTCDFNFSNEINTACKETQAVAAFGFLAWLPLLGYTVLLLVLAIIRQTNGIPVWLLSVKESFRDGTDVTHANGPTIAPQFMETKVMDSPAPPSMPYTPPTGAATMTTYPPSGILTSPPPHQV
ncbi:hypothetical protein OBBRIDRAFT_822585 [Obba rivulosa]|uniref:MARVEL domain-containing protein n=1 Tax=Obba rivulosa TaxID=1052685 RepID=A0A8E2J6U5_9APHY|nr:hypothetical protein OBBRIDRAFT_822585 [Obba rivulosa]